MFLTTIKAKLIAGFAMMLLLLAGTTGTSIVRMQSFVQEMEDIVEGKAQLVAASTELTNLAEGLASRLLMLFVLDERDQRVEIYRQIDSKNAAMDQLIETMLMQTEGSQNASVLEQLKNHKTRYQQSLQATVEALEFGELEDAKQQMSGDTRQQLERFIGLAQQFAAQQQQAMDAQQSDIIEKTDESILIIGVLALLALGLGGFLSWSLPRHIVLPLLDITRTLKDVAKGDVSSPLMNKGHGEVAQLTEQTEHMRQALVRLISQIESSIAVVIGVQTELSQGVEAVRTGGHKQARLVSGIGESVSHLHNASEQVSAKVVAAKAQASSAHELAQHGAQVIQQASTEIANVANFIASGADSVADLEESAKTVTTFVDNIRDIADQTNLLALNASIEAARAGDSGRGFAVVADEVRNLANNTANVTQSINDVITTISTLASKISKDMADGQERMHHGVNQIEAVVGPLVKLEQDSEIALEHLSDLDDMSEQLAAHANQIRTQTDDIVAVIEQNSEASSSLESLTEKLQSAAHNSKALTAQFQLPE